MREAGFEPAKLDAMDLKSIPVDQTREPTLLVHTVGFEPTKHYTSNLEFDPVNHSERVLSLYNINYV